MKDTKHIPGLMERIPGSGIWWIRYTDSRGKRHLEKAGRKGDAIDLLSKRNREKLLAVKLPEKLRGKIITFRELAQDALDHSAESNVERSTLELALKLGIIGPDFADRPAAGITKHDIQSWLMEYAQKRDWAPATRNRYQAAFSLVFSVALDNEKMTINPAARIKRKTENNDRIRFLSADEEQRLISALAKTCPHYLPAFRISLHTGMRKTEQFTLRWDQVSLDRKTVSLYRTKGKKTRHINLNAIALSAFQSLKRGARGKDPVFLTPDGLPLQASRDWFDPAMKLAGLEDYTWHCNRHTFASRLVMAGVDIRTVAALMGHATIQMTMRYAHLAPEQEQMAVDRLVPSEALVTKSVTGYSTRKLSK